MGCSCKNSSNKQVTSVKQVIKKPIQKITSSRPKKINVTKRVVFK